MKIIVISHKECWVDPVSPSGYSTIGGFPFQIEAISDLFDETELMVPIRATPLPSGARPLRGHNLHILPLKEPFGEDTRRKISLLFWLPRNLPRIWGEIRKAEAVHTPVPGDIGTIGILAALVLRKPLFVRHCGTWGEPATLADRFLLLLLQRIAGRRNVVMATGGADTLPCRKNQAIRWIFSTTLSKRDMSAIPPNRPWRSGQSLKLVTVGRLSQSKNTAAVIQALALVRKKYPLVSLDVVGDGVCLHDLRRLTHQLDLVDAVTFHGNVSHKEVMKILGNGHLFVFPTQVKEGFPKAVLEALVCGLPVIATAISVIPYLIENRSGIHLKETGPKTVARAILQLVVDPERLAEMSMNARQTAVGFTLERWRDLIGERLRAAWGPLRQDKR